MIFIFLLLPFFVFCQNKGIRVLPEAGLSNPIGDFKAENVFAKRGVQFGLHLEKMWGKFGLGVYGGMDMNDIQFDDVLPAGNSGLSLTKSENIVQNQWKQFLAAAGPVLKLDLSKKINIELTSKLGLAKVSYPDFGKFLEVGAPLNQAYTLYQTKNETIEQKLNPVLFSALRINFKLAKRVDLSLSGNYKFVKDVLHSYSFLNAEFTPEMSNDALIQTLRTAPTYAEVRKCDFNSFGVAVGLSFIFGKDKPKDKMDPPVPDYPENVPVQDSCLNSLIRNSEFNMGINRASGTSFWTTAYGNPAFLNTPGEGCFDPGYVEFSGDQKGGDAIAQKLDAANGIKLGKKYVVNIAVRFFDQANTLDYARIRVIAFNNVLPSTGAHPDPGPNVAIIGRSGKIKDCGDWSIIEFPVWMANKNFSNIAVNVFTNDGTTATILIDNITICEVSNTYDCDELQVDASGKPIIPPGPGNLPAGFTCIPEPEEDEFYNGALQDLYGGLYGYDGTDNWYANASDKCFSIGGTLPDGIAQYNCDDSLKMAGINMTCEEFKKLLDGPVEGHYINDLPANLPPIGNLTANCSDYPLPKDFGNMAFGGKDIIYIHGLSLDHVFGRILNIPPEAALNWPADQTEFYGSGYYKKSAEKTWKNHIKYFATDKNYLNRYLVVSYNCSQRLDVAIHSVLTQIREAMETGRGVKVPHPNDPRGTGCFGREYVIISQSTGAIVSDVVLAVAEKTKADPVYAAKYGNLGLIADRCKGHIARRGAFTGSDLATILVGIANQASPTATILATAMALQQDDPIVDVRFNYPVIRQSILVDLIPSYTRSHWGPYMDHVPVPVLTVTGGHPSFISENQLALTNLSGLIGVPQNVVQAAALSMKHVIHPGYDDGVITMDCASARKNTYSSQSNFKPTKLVKVFDMGIPTARAISYFVDQRLPLDPLKFGAASSPFLSPTGMVQPVSSYAMNTPYNNHYSFIQAASEHWIKKDASQCCDYNTTALGGSPNNEEELVVNDVSLYNPVTGIIDPAIIPQMGEFIVGEYIWVPDSIKFKKKGLIWIPVVHFKPLYIWKRTYHKFRDPGLYDCDYVYKYLFKN
ncbi:MAG: hypothetical protein KDC85_10870 [Saprospiraceae bacterium]|nr:hypothetical protein [Saprospiraceae bacterium]MCB9322460.1 hypothetical protein [Lewinellaceae bacterium]